MLLGCASPCPADAQHAFIGTFDSRGQEVAILHDLARGLLRWTAPLRPGTSSPNGPPVFTADGRWVLQPRILPFLPFASLVELRDVLTGSMALLPIDFHPLLAHPRDLAVWGTSGDYKKVMRLDLAGLTEIYACGYVSRLDTTLTGDRLLINCDLNRLVVVDAKSGNVLGDHRHSTVAGCCISSADGMLAAMAIDETVRVIDTATGGLVAERHYPMLGHVTPYLRLLPTASRDELVVFGRWAIHDEACGLSVLRRSADLLSFSALQTVRTLPFDRHDALFVAASPHGDTYVVGSSCHNWFATVADVASGVLRLHASPLPRTVTEFAMSFAPLAPSTPTVTVTGQTVRLAWTLPAESPAVTGYSLEVGSASGLADLVTLPLGAAIFAADAVPPGRYFVRVRAHNTNGASPPSGEVLVVIPSN
jgi:hypothetical protein